MIEIECFDCKIKFYCNGDTNCQNEYTGKIEGCWCPECSEKNNFTEKDFPYCYVGCPNKEKVEFT